MPFELLVSSCYYSTMTVLWTWQTSNQWLCPHKSASFGDFITPLLMINHSRIKNLRGEGHHSQPSIWSLYMPFPWMVITWNTAMNLFGISSWTSYGSTMSPISSRLHRIERLVDHFACKAFPLSYANCLGHVELFFDKHHDALAYFLVAASSKTKLMSKFQVAKNTCSLCTWGDQYHVWFLDMHIATITWNTAGKYLIFIKFGNGFARLPRFFDHYPFRGHINTCSVDEPKLTWMQRYLYISVCHLKDPSYSLSDSTNMINWNRLDWRRLARGSFAPQPWALLLPRSRRCTTVTLHIFDYFE